MCRISIKNLILVPSLLILSNLAIAQSSEPELFISGIGRVEINMDIRKYPQFAKVVDEEEVRSLEQEFEIYKVHYKYAVNRQPLFLNCAMKKIAVAVDLKNKITAVYMLCPFSKSIMDSLIGHYGKPRRLTGFINELDQIKNKEVAGIYAWYQGKLLAYVLNDSALYGKTKDNENMMIISFTNGQAESYLLYYPDALILTVRPAYLLFR